MSPADGAVEAARRETLFDRQLREAHRKAAQKAPSGTYMVDCEHCNGSGKVEAVFVGCGDTLTNATVNEPFGYEGDDICRKCEAQDQADRAALRKAGL